MLPRKTLVKNSGCLNTGVWVYGLKFTLIVMEALLSQRVQSLPAAATPAKGPVLWSIPKCAGCSVTNDSVALIGY